MAFPEPVRELLKRLMENWSDNNDDVVKLGLLLDLSNRHEDQLTLSELHLYERELGSELARIRLAQDMQTSVAGELVSGIRNHGAIGGAVWIVRKMATESQLAILETLTELVFKYQQDDALYEFVLLASSVCFRDSNGQIPIPVHRAIQMYAMASVLNRAERIFPDLVSSIDVIRSAD